MPTRSTSQLAGPCSSVVLTAVPDSFSSSASLIRQLRALVILLIVSNIALGAYGFYLLRTIDRNYSILIDQSVPILNGLQTVTAMASDAMRSTNPDLLTEYKLEPAEVANGARAAMRRDKALREELLNRNWLVNAETQRVSVQQAGQTFNRVAAEVINLIEANKAAEANRQREAELRQAYNGYLAATTKAAELLQNKSLETSGNLSVRSGNLARLMLSLGTWPMMILGAFFLFTAVFVIGVLVRVKLLGGEAA